jgi:AAA15 family ATPase/GTPase
MIKTLKLENFRCFETVNLEELKQINIVTGDNGSGKTALLESIMIGSRGLVSAILQINAERNINPDNSFSALLPTIFNSLTPDQFRLQWDTLFYNYQTEKKINIQYSDIKNNKFDLLLYYSKENIGQISLGGQDNIAPFIIERRKNKEQSQKISVKLTKNQLFQDGTIEQFGHNLAFFPSKFGYSMADNIKWFSDLSIRNEEKEVIEIMKDFFPFIKGITTLSPGSIQSIFIDLGDKKLQTPLVSEGLNKILSIVLASIIYKNGIIVIDEIENGIFHERYKKLWKIICKLAKEQKNQLFISTHSLECLQALTPTINQDNAGDFCLLQFSRVPNDDKSGSINFRNIPGNILIHSLSSDIEIR